MNFVRVMDVEKENAIMVDESDVESKQRVEKKGKANAAEGVGPCNLELSAALRLSSGLYLKPRIVYNAWLILFHALINPASIRGQVFLRGQASIEERRYVWHSNQDFHV